MLALILVAGALLWFGVDRKKLRDRKYWPIIALTLVGLVLTVKGRPLVGLAMLAGAMVWVRKPWEQLARPIDARDSLARADAYDLLGLPAGADPEAIVAAHRRLIARNHPDSGGSAGLAARLNAARDLLLKPATTQVQQERH